MCRSFLVRFLLLMMKCYLLCLALQRTCSLRLRNLLEKYKNGIFLIQLRRQVALLFDEPVCEKFKQVTHVDLGLLDMNTPNSSTNEKLAFEPHSTDHIRDSRQFKIDDYLLLEPTHRAFPVCQQANRILVACRKLKMSSSTAAKAAQAANRVIAVNKVSLFPHSGLFNSHPLHAFACRDIDVVLVSM